MNKPQPAQPEPVKPDQLPPSKNDWAAKGMTLEQWSNAAAEAFVESLNAAAIASAPPDPASGSDPATVAKR